MDRAEALAYCAGLFDGEGCIMVRRWVDHRPHPVKKTGQPGVYLRHELHIEIKQVRPEAVRFIHEVFGGRLSFSRRHGRQAKYAGEWLWTIDSTRAADVLRAMRPYLLLKGTEADVAIQFQALKLKRGQGSRSFKLGLTLAEVEERDSLHFLLQRMKRSHNASSVQDEYASHKPVSLPIHT